jgi:hypothetical protein
MIAEKQNVASSMVVASNNLGRALEVLDYTFQNKELKLSPGNIFCREID